MEINKSATYEDVEQAILSEDNYNWKKHFIFQLPELFGAIVKMFVLYVVFMTLVTIIMSSVFAVVLKMDYSEVIQKEVINDYGIYKGDN